MNFIRHPFAKFMLLFFGAFCFFYYGSLFLIGASDPRGMVYWPRFTNFFNVFGWLTEAIVSGAMALLDLLGYDPIRFKFNGIRVGKAGVTIASVCLGYGVMSFWLAFVIANRPKLKYLLLWSIGGLFTIYLINTVRVVLIILGVHHKWFNPRNVTHDMYHNTFNVVAYGFIFLLMWAYSKWDNRTAH